MNRRRTDRPRDIDETVAVEIEGIPAELRILAERDDGLAIVSLMVRMSHRLLAMLAIEGDDVLDVAYLYWRDREFALPADIDRLYITRGWWELHRAHDLEEAAVAYLRELDDGDRQDQQDAAAEVRAEFSLRDTLASAHRAWAKANGLGV